MKRWPAAGVVFGVLWVFVRGAELAVDALLGQFLLGTAVGLPVAFVFRRFYDEGIDVFALARAVPYAVRYLVVFLWEIIVANLDVAYRVLAPGQPIEPQVLLVPLRVATDVGITTIANSITITPGTLTLDHDADRNALYVHVIDGRNIDDVVESIRTWEEYALVIFDEERSPDDRAPEVTIHPPDHDPPDPTKTTSRESASTSSVQSRDEEASDAGGDADGR